MPANKNALMRYRAIDRCISNKYKPFPTMQDLIDACKEAVYDEVSSSAIQKDIKAMKEEESLGYFAPIEYSRTEKGYYYSDPDYTLSSLELNNDELEAVGFASTILQQFKDIGIFQIYGDAVERIFQAVKINKTAKDIAYKNVIHFEKAHSYLGNEHISPILSHITNKEVIEFSYFSFEKQVHTERCLHPYVLKEYRNRWYVIGLDDNYNEIRTYALDRLEHLNKSKKAWRESPNFDAELFFKHSFGIYYIHTPPEKVVLSFEPREKYYIESQPIHSTQEVLIDNEKEYRISINVFIEYDLIMYIRGCGERVKILEPAHLKESIKESFEKALKNYK